jgi:hypothetical protein
MFVSCMLHDFLFEAQKKTKKYVKENVLHD